MPTSPVVMLTMLLLLLLIAFAIVLEAALEGYYWTHMLYL